MRFLKFIIFFYFQYSFVLPQIFDQFLYFVLWETLDAVYSHGAGSRELKILSCLLKQLFPMVSRLSLFSADIIAILKKIFFITLAKSILSILWVCLQFSYVSASMLKSILYFYRFFVFLLNVNLCFWRKNDLIYQVVSNQKRLILQALLQKFISRDR